MAESDYVDTERRANLSKTGVHAVANEINVPAPAEREYDAKFLDVLDKLIEDAHGIGRPEDGASYNPPITVYDDFNLGENRWKDYADGGATTFGTCNGTWVKVDTAGTNNKERYLGTEAAPIKISDMETGDQLVFAARVKEGSQTGDAANYAIGLSDCVDASTLQDDGAGPCNDYDHIMFYKIDGGTDWQTSVAQAESSVGTCDTETDTCGDAEVGIVVDVGLDEDGAFCSTKSRVQMYLDGSVVDTQEVANATMDDPLHVFFGAKAGDANAAGLDVDYIAVGATRRKS